MHTTVANSWQRFSKGFLGGSLVGFILLAYGLLAWRIGILIGVEADTSTRGLSVTPLYVLSFGLGGGAITLLEGHRARWVGLVVSWIMGATIVLLGCGIVASLVVFEEPIGAHWGLLSSAILLVLLITSAIGYKQIPE